jgi:gliding motility-associated-like protein
MNCLQSQNIKLIVVTVSLLCCSQAKGQLNVSSGFTPQELVQDFFIGSGVQISNVTLGAQTQNAQLGAFSNSNSNLAISNGILLSTGYASDAAVNGSNLNSSFSSQNPNCPPNVTGLCLAGDSDLDAIVGISTKDAAVLEFDFVPLSDTVRFRYVFASEEYNEYTCSQFNDVFAFLLTGPGFNNTNIALIPNTNIPVAINTVNNGLVGFFGSVNNCTGSNGSLNYSNYFVNNGGGAHVQFDGMTIVMEAVAVVQPCQTYHIKLAVADVNDGAFDSGVFLEANSFSSSIPTVTFNTPNDDSIIVENCQTGSVLLSFGVPQNVNRIISYNVLGTATNGVDYQNLPGNITIPSGQSVAQIDILPIADNTNEGSETIILEIQTAPCYKDTVIIYLRDEDILNEPQVGCDSSSAVSVSYSWNAVPLATGYRVSSNQGMTWDTLLSSELAFTVYDLQPAMTSILWVQALGGWSVCTPHPIGKDSCSTIICTLSGQLVSTTATSCFGVNDGLVEVQAINGVAHYSYVLDSFFNKNAPIISGISGGNHIVTIIDKDSCMVEIPFNIQQPLPILITLDSLQSPSCFNSSDGIAYLSASDGIGNYQYAMNGDTNTTGIFTNLGIGTYMVTVIDDNDCANTKSFSATGPTPITLSASVTQTRCFNENSGSASVSPTGGTVAGSYQYIWNNNQTDSVATNLLAGNYSVTINDDNGCFITTTLTVTEPSAIQFMNVLTTPTSCFGENDGTAAVAANGGNGGFSYLWSNGGMTSSTSQLLAGNHIVTATDSRGCQDSLVVNIQQPSELLITNIDINHVTCFNAADGEATAFSNENNITYQWLPTNQTTATATNLATGQHIVILTNSSGCTATDTISITQPTQIIVIPQELESASCFQKNDGKAIATVSGGTPFSNGTYQYQWNTTPSQTTAIATQLIGGTTYQVIVTDTLGCQGTNNIFINHPNELIASTVVNDILCYNGNDGNALAQPTGGTPPYQYQWSNNTTQNTVNQLSEGTYQLTVTDIKNCETTTNFTVNEPAALILDLNKTDVACRNEATGKAEALITGGTPNYQFKWSDQQQSSEIQNLLAGWYIVTVTDGNQCTITDSIFIIEPNTALTGTFKTTDVSCFGDRNGRISIAANGGKQPYQYSLDGENFTNAAEWAGVFAGNYVVTIRDDNGCFFDSVGIINEPEAIEIDAGEDVLLDWGEKIGLSVVVQKAQMPILYQWLPSESLSCMNCPAPIAQPENDVFYEIIITDANGCIASDDIAIRVKKEKQIHIPTGFSPNRNGINDFLFVQADEGKVASILQFEIFNRWGERVFITNNISPNEPNLGWDGTFKGLLLDAGVFGWVVEVEFIDGEIRVFKGNTTLIR